MQTGPEGRLQALESCLASPRVFSEHCSCGTPSHYYPEVYPQEIEESCSKRQWVNWKDMEHCYLSLQERADVSVSVQYSQTFPQLAFLWPSEHAKGAVQARKLNVQKQHFPPDTGNHTPIYQTTLPRLPMMLHVPYLYPSTIMFPSLPPAAQAALCKMVTQQQRKKFKKHCI